MQHKIIMTEQMHFFQTLEKIQGSSLRQASWKVAQLNPGPVNLLSQKKLAENMLERTLPLFDVREDLNRIAGLKPLYEGINLLDPYDWRRDEAQRMLEKCLGLHDHQRIQLAGAVMHFMDIVKQTDLNTLQLKTAKILTLWCKMFPQSKAWNALKWLWNEGVSVLRSQSGFRAWRRFSRGSLADPENILEIHSKEWLALCEEQNDFATAFEADRMAAAFSGDVWHAGLERVCVEVPNYENWELSSECLWCTADTNSVKIKITEKIQLNLISAVDIPELMCWLLTSNPEEDKALEHRLNPATPLKDWSRKRLRRL
jgi:hypothetical protein